jgi:ADP-heptose:LPS heptosyltransferase
MKMEEKRSMMTILIRTPSYLGWLFNYSLYLISIVFHRYTSRYVRNDKPRLLLLRPDGAGDVVLFSASIPLYRELFPAAHIVLLVVDRTTNLVEHCPLVDEVWLLSRRKFRFNPFERWRWCWKLASHGFDLAINTVYSTNYRHLDCLIGWTRAPRRLAHQCLDSIGRRDRTFPYFTELVPAHQEWKFEIDRNHDMLRHIGYSGEANHKTTMWMDKSDGSSVSTFLETFKGDHYYAVLAPGSADKNRIWDANDFVLSIKQIQQHFPLRWIVDGDAGDYERCSYIVQRLSVSGISAVNTAGKTTLRDLSLLIEGSVLVLANESGPIHIAAALGAPTVCILSGGFYGRFYPYPGNPLTIAVTHKLPCYNCSMHCILPEVECVTKIGVGEVVDAALNVLSQAQGLRPSSKSL